MSGGSCQLATNVSPNPPAHLESSYRGSLPGDADVARSLATAVISLALSVHFGAICREARIRKSDPPPSLLGRGEVISERAPSDEVTPAAAGPRSRCCGCRPMIRGHLRHSECSVYPPLARRRPEATRRFLPTVPFYCTSDISGGQSRSLGPIIRPGCQLLRMALSRE